METRKLMQLYLHNAGGGGDAALNLDSEYFKEYIEYLNKEYDTKFPNFINEKNLLAFDSNFECGNLDSVYVVNENEYNLLMKVDTNTKGSSFWFYFKVKGIWKSSS